MPFVVAHMLTPMIILDIIRDNILKTNKSNLPNKYIIIAGIFGLLPDIDVPLSMLFGGLSMHRLFTHAIFIPAFFLLMSSVLYFLKKKEWAKILFMCFFGWSVHLLLDFSLLGTICVFCPLSTAKYGLNIIAMNLNDPASMDKVFLRYSSLDAILLWFWFIKMELRKKVSDIF